MSYREISVLFVKCSMKIKENEMKKIICDRCGDECVNGTYYTIDIYGYDMDDTPKYGISVDAANQNLGTNLSKVWGTEQRYCKKCRDEIWAFMFHNERK